MAEFDPTNRVAILSRDTSTDVERLQVEARRRMSPLEKVGVMSQATRDNVSMVVVALDASWIPGRATKVDPLVALRCD